MRGSFRDFEHLIRLAGIFVAGLLLFAVARAEFVPDDFGKYGHYRAGAIADVAARPMAYAGRARCTECHEDEVNEAAPAKHKVISCETCHESAGDAMARIRSLTAGYAIPDGACTTYRVCLQELEAFERDLHEHVHLENNILFPKAARLEAAMGWL